MQYFSHSSLPSTLSIGACPPPPQTFSEVEQVVASFRRPDFLDLTLLQRFKEVNRSLYRLICEAPREAFLLSALLDFFDRVNRENILQAPLDFPSFEFWLNNFAALSESENYEVRAKIIGKHIPREEYQAFFPVGMNKIYPGSHFVTAHLSPDIDTMIASFFGWMDGFGARVGSCLHFWCLPGGPPDSPITTIFQEMLGQNIFLHLARTSPSLALTAMDLIHPKLWIKVLGHTAASAMDHGPDEQPIIVVNKEDNYLGEWHDADAELVRQIVIPFKSCLRWFENNLHTRLITLFSKTKLSTQDLPAFYASIFDITMGSCEPIRDLNEQQTSHLHDFFNLVLGVEKGLDGTFRHLHEALATLSVPQLLDFQHAVESLSFSELFDAKGSLKEERPRIFERLKQLIKQLDRAMFDVHHYIDRLDVLLTIKHTVLRLPHLYLTLRSGVDEMRQKMQHRNFLTILTHEQDGSTFPVGVIQGDDLHNASLGTVSFRDFCNSDEVHMPPYLQVISIVDHHKSSLKTPSVPTATIGDAQSCNVLIAEKAFALNDRYSLGGIPPEDIEEQIQAISQEPTTPSQIRILQRLLNRRLAALRGNRFYVHPAREVTEYMCLLYAILDDTDLLTKVSRRDVVCVADLLNRLKSLLVHREVEIIHFDDLTQDESFVTMAAQRILRQSDMHSLYKRVYTLREAEVEDNLKKCAHGESSSVFLDSKEQNGCARVGQTKIFASNFSLFAQNAPQLRRLWLQQAREIHEKKPEIDLYIHMISTIASAEEVYQDQPQAHPHQDEWWLWVPALQQGYDHLDSFLAAVQPILKEFQDNMWLEFIGTPKEEFVRIFSRQLPWVPTKDTATKAHPPMATLHFKAGALNSRKSAVTPHLPYGDYTHSS